MALCCAWETFQMNHLTGTCAHSNTMMYHRVTGHCARKNLKHQPALLNVTVVRTCCPRHVTCQTVKEVTTQCWLVSDCVFRFLMSWPPTCRGTKGTSPIYWFPLKTPIFSGTTVGTRGAASVAQRWITGATGKGPSLSPSDVKHSQKASLIFFFYTRNCSLS